MDTAREVEQSVSFVIADGTLDDDQRTSYGLTADHLYRRVWTLSSKHCDYHRLVAADIPDGFDVRDPSTYSLLPSAGWEALWSGSYDQN